MGTKANKTSYKKGHKSWNIGGYRRITRPCSFCGIDVRRSISSMKSINIFCSNVCRLKNQENKSKEFDCIYCDKHCKYEDYNFERSVKYCSRKCYIYHKREVQKGARSHFWKGGLTSKNILIRGSSEYAEWRKKVFERDNYTCVSCGLRSGNGKAVTLNADHIKPFFLYPELRFDITNGRTLCLTCHKNTDTYGGKTRQYHFS